MASNVKMSKPIFDEKIYSFAIINVCTIEYWSFNYENTEYSWLHRF